MDIPAPAPVVDEFQLLQPGEADSLKRILLQIKQKAGVEISVFIPASLRGRAIEDFSIATAEKWGLGQKKVDKGLLFVIAPRERKMRLEVGYGLEGEVTDAFSRRVLDNGVRPYFKEGRYYEGILAGLSVLQEKIPLQIEEGSVPPARGKRANVPLFAFIVFLVIFVSFLRVLGMLGFIPMSRHTRYGGWGGHSGWGSRGGFGGGGSWGGGGGGFGGGGSSSSW